ncbi:hypothetical protein D3C80_2230640 [compost metagenome]
MHHDLATTAGDSVFVAEHRALNLAPLDRRLDQHFFIEAQCQLDRRHVFGFVGHLAHTDG